MRKHWSCQFKPKITKDNKVSDASNHNKVNIVPQQTCSFYFQMVACENILLTDGHCKHALFWPYNSSQGQRSPSGEGCVLLNQRLHSEGSLTSDWPCSSRALTSVEVVCYMKTYIHVVNSSLLCSFCFYWPLWRSRMVYSIGRTCDCDATFSVKPPACLTVVEHTAECLSCQVSCCR